MVLDTLENAGKYVSLHPLFGRAFEYLGRQKSHDPGTFEVVGKDLYVIISDTKGEAPKEPKLEAHRKYIDIQVTLEGGFDIGWKPVTDCSRVSKTYDAENDYLLYDDAPELWVSLKEGTFGIFFPEDAHAPKVSPSHLKKAVFKVAVSQV